MSDGAVQIGHSHSHMEEGGGMWETNEQYGALGQIIRYYGWGDSWPFTIKQMNTRLYLTTGYKCQKKKIITILISPK